MPFGRSKKDTKDSKDDDEKRSALFGGRSKSSKSSDTSSNPYANVGGSSDPYSTGASNPPPYDNGGSRSQYAQEKSAVPVGGYGRDERGGSSSQPRYGGSSNYGASSGYGSGNPYGNDRQPEPRQSGRSGGYGGFGRGEDDPNEPSRAALFGDAPSRTRQQQPSRYDAASLDQRGTASYGGDDSYSNGYGGSSGYPDRELTAEEQEEEDVQASKNEIRHLKQQDVASTRNARRIAEQAEATGRETLARLGEQGERIFNAERNLDLASVQNRIASEKAAEIKTLNRSMFAVHVGNPFTKGRREERANEMLLEKHRGDREKSDATRREMQGDASRRARDTKGLDNGYDFDGERKKNLAARGKYQFEADSEDEDMENEIDENLDVIHRGARTLNALGKAMGAELDSQNKHIARITGKTDRVDDEIASNMGRLNRIR